MLPGSSSSSKKKNVSDSHLSQISILRSLCPDGSGLRQYQLEEITQSCGLTDEKEVQRFLYILEGQKLVSPCPEGDFTSRIWAITTEGVRALKVINQAMAA